MKTLLRLSTICINIIICFIYWCSQEHTHIQAISSIILVLCVTKVTLINIKYFGDNFGFYYCTTSLMVKLRYAYFYLVFTHVWNWWTMMEQVTSNNWFRMRDLFSLLSVWLLFVLLIQRNWSTLVSHTVGILDSKIECDRK